MNPNNAQISRRQILRAGSAVLALPWLETFAGAAEQTPPKRIICVCTSFGLYGPSFFPAQPGHDYEASEYLRVLDDLRENFTVFSGISHPEIGGDHASDVSFLTSAKHPTRPGFRNTVSLDVLASQHVAGATRFPLMTLTTLGGGGNALSYTPAGAGITPLNVPSQIYARMFLAGNLADVEKELARLKRGQSMLDRMRERLGQLEKSVSNHDRQQIADYTEAVRDLEKQLVAEQAWVNRPKPTVTESAPNENYPSPFADRSDSIGRAKVLFQLARLAIQTDSTRVITIFIYGMDEKPPIDGVTEGHHALTHHGRNPEKIEQLKIVEKMKMGAFRELLTSLRDSKEGAASLLDSTQVLIGSNLGDASGHGTTNLPILLAGGGYRHGQHIAGDPENNTPLANLYVNMLQKFGMPTDKFGSSTGTITELS
jgi:hypothetical protein